MKYMEDELFKGALKEKDLNKIMKVSKGDVHNHCGAGMRFSVFNKWAGGKVNQAAKKMDGLEGLNNYMADEIIKYINKKEDVEFLIEETVKEAINDGVKILETSISIQDMIHYPKKDEFFHGIEMIKSKYNDQIDFRPELGMLNNLPNEDLENFLIACIDSNVFKSIDLYGDEVKDNFERFKEYYKYAKKKGLKLKAHAGQFSDHENVKRAIEILEVDEIQHGIGAVSDQYTMDLIKERKIRLNICPSSNYILGAVKDIKKHPARKLFDNGIRITINSDDLLLFDSGVSEEYLLLYNLGLFNIEELNEIRKNSLI